jgi:hypothetical protein
MALIQAGSGRSDGGYTRVVGDPLLGKLLSRIQSAVIRSGNELEKLVSERVCSLDDVDSFLALDIYPEGIFLAPKKVLKKVELLTAQALNMIL